MRNSLVSRKLGLHLLHRRPPDGDEGALVAHRIAVVGGGEDCDALAVVTDLVAFVFDLVAPDDIVETVRLQEVLGYVGAELAADAPF